jgi:hypothetical protein
MILLGRYAINNAADFGKDQNCNAESFGGSIHNY